MSENPKCPYCGEEMKFSYGYDGYMNGHYWYRCDNCNALAPEANSPEEAYAAAMKRDRAKGKWIFVLESLLSTTYRCSHCGNYFEEHSNTLNAGRGDKKYCPNCGADMKEEDDE